MNLLLTQTENLQSVDNFTSQIFGKLFIQRNFITYAFLTRKNFIKRKFTFIFRTTFIQHVG